MATKVWQGGASGAANSWSTAANWSPSGVPTNSDDVYLDGAQSVVDISAGLDQSAVTLDSLHILDSYTGTVGTASAALQIGATNVFLHEPSNQDNASGSRRINLDLGSVQSDIVIYGSATTSADTGAPPIRIVGTNAHNTASISGTARIGFAAGSPTESATIKELNTSLGAVGSGPNVVLGVGCTLTTIEISGGTVDNRGANASTVLVTNGAYRVRGAATHASMTIDGNGEAVHASSGAVSGTITVGGQGLLDCSRDSRSKTIDKIVMRGSATVNLDNGNPNSITVTNGVDRYGSSTLTLWRGGINVALSSV